MTSGRRRVGVTVAFVGWLTTVPLLAQTGPYEEDLDPKQHIEGLQPVQVLQFRERLDALLAYLRGLDAVRAPPPTVCMRLKSWVELSAARTGTAQASLEAHMPISFKDGRCHRMTISGIGFSVNNDHGLFTSDHLLSDLTDDDHRFYVLDIAPPQGRVVQIGNHSRLLLRAAGAYPWRPVTRQRYLQRAMVVWQAQVDRYVRTRAESEAALARTGGRLKPLSASEQRWLDGLRSDIAAAQAELTGPPTDALRGPACREIQRLQPAPCALRHTVVEPNPDYWRGAAPERIHLIRIHTPAVQDMQESRDKFETRMRVRDSLDLQRLLALMDA